MTTEAGRRLLDAVKVWPADKYPAVDRRKLLAVLRADLPRIEAEARRALLAEIRAEVTNDDGIGGSGVTLYEPQEEALLAILDRAEGETR